MRTAFALAGLGGNNAYGAGFLTAAQDLQRQRNAAAAEAGTGEIAPDGTGDVRAERERRGILRELEFISCTSGAIASTASYLRGDNLLTELQARLTAVDKAVGLPQTAWAEPWRAPLLALFTGVPGVFGPWAEAFTQHLWTRPSAYFSVPRTVEEIADLWMPARTFVPRLPDEFFDGAAATFNDPAHGVGVALNSFDPITGVEHLYVNDAGMALIREHHDRNASYGVAHGRTVYQPITQEGLRAALWLFFYGFPSDRPGGNHVDGAYARSIIIDELTFAERIYAVKPVNDRWIGRLPRNLLEVQDMQTELWMNGAWREQSRLIDTVNRMHEGDRLDPAASRKPYHLIDLVPVEIQQQRGFFTYFMEDRKVFDNAYEQGLTALRQRERVTVSA